MMVPPSRREFVVCWLFFLMLRATCLGLYTHPGRAVEQPGYLKLLFALDLLSVTLSYKLSESSFTSKGHLSVSYFIFPAPSLPFHASHSTSLTFAMLEIGEGASMSLSRGCKLL